MSDITRLDEIKLRAALVKVKPSRWLPGSVRAEWAATVAMARDDVPWLVAEVERLRAENESLWDNLHREQHSAMALAAERDAALAAVTELRHALGALVRLKDGPRDDAYRALKDDAWQQARDVLSGTVGQDACPHCEVSGRCVGSCLDDPREDPNGE